MYKLLKYYKFICQIVGVNVLTYDFENVKEPLYEYIYKLIKSDIIAGNLKAGEKLPSKRTFARNNGISTITIQNAYDQLMSEGYIFSLPKKGYYVANIDIMSRISKEARITLDIQLPEEKVSYDIDLSNNEINPDNFPFSIWAKLSRETIANRKKN